MQPQLTISHSLFIKRLIALVVVILVIVAMFVGFSLFKSAKFRMLNTSPSLTNVGAESPFIDVYFNKPLNSKSLSLSSNIVSSYSTDGDRLTLNFKVLQIGKQYSIVIRSIRDTNGSLLSNLTLDFTAKQVPYNDLTKRQQQAIVGAQDQYIAPLKNPILAHLPYGSLDYQLSASFQGPQQTQLVLQAQIFIPPGVAGSQESTVAAQHEQEVNQYIESLGLNPANYTIQYQIVPESLSSGSQTP